MASLAKFTARTKDTDFGYNKLIRELNLLKFKPHAKIGVIGASAMQAKKSTLVVAGKATSVKDPVETVVSVAFKNEFGVKGKPGIPERSFLRRTWDQKNRRWQFLTDRQMDKILKGQTTVRKALTVLGIVIQRDFKRKINATDPAWPENAPLTRKKKGSSKPLIDTGQLINSIHPVVLMKGR